MRLIYGGDEIVTVVQSAALTEGETASILHFHDISKLMWNNDLCLQHLNNVGGGNIKQPQQRVISGIQREV